MPLLVLIVLFALLGGVVSALAAGVLVLASARQRTYVLPHLVSFATGALLGAAFLGLIPHAVQSAGPGHVHAVGLAILLGVLLFFVLEKAILWRHCHAADCEAHTPEGLEQSGAHHRQRASGMMILFGDGLHNFLDGILIAAAFLTDVHLGIVTSIAIIAHEVPQEIGDVAILLHSGLAPVRAMLFNIGASLTTVIGAVGAYFWLESVTRAQPYVLAVAGASFIYIAVADLIPGLHQRSDLRGSAAQVLFIALGVSVIFVTHSYLH